MPREVTLWQFKTILTTPSPKTLCKRPVSMCQKYSLPMTDVVEHQIEGKHTCRSIILPVCTHATLQMGMKCGTKRNLLIIFTTRNSEAPPGFLHSLSSNDSKSTSITGKPLIFPAASKSIPLGCDLALGGKEKERLSTLRVCSWPLCLGSKLLSLKRNTHKSKEIYSS